MLCSACRLAKCEERGVSVTLKRVSLFGSASSILNVKSKMHLSRLLRSSVGVLGWRCSYALEQLEQSKELAGQHSRSEKKLPRNPDEPDWFSVQNENGQHL